MKAKDDKIQLQLIMTMLKNERSRLPVVNTGRGGGRGVHWWWECWYFVYD